MGKYGEEVKMAPEASLLVIIFTFILGATSFAGGLVTDFIYQNNATVPNQADLTAALTCMYQTNLAQMIALISALCLLVAHVSVSLNGGCVCCCSLLYARGKAHFFSMVTFTLAWITFSVSMVCFLSGAYINSFHTSTTFFSYDFDLRRCFTVKSYVYLVAAIAALVTTFFDLLYYGQAQKSKFEAWVEQGAPTPRIYNKEKKKTFVIAGPAKRGPLKDIDEQRKLKSLGEEKKKRTKKRPGTAGAKVHDGRPSEPRRREHV